MTTTFTTIIMALLLAVGSTACGKGEERARLGSSAVYIAIDNSDDCDWLQQQHDLAGDNHDRAVANGEPVGPGSAREITLSYMNAALERQQDIGCFE